MYAFAYHQPTSLKDAASLLAGEDAKLVAGGHTLIPTMKQRLAAPGTLIDLGKVRHLPCTIVQGRYDIVCPPVTAKQM